MFGQFENLFKSYMLCLSTARTVEDKAEMVSNSKNRFAELKASTLVIGGDRDYYCPAELLREAAGEI